MDHSDVKIVIIDDNMKETDALLVHLKLNFKNADVVLKKNAAEGQDYIFSRLGNKMVVLLDYDLGQGQPNATDIFLKIREKTALLYVIIITANLMSKIPHEDLIKYINNDALAFIDKTMSLEQKGDFVKKAIHSMNVRVDCALEQWVMNHTDEELQKPYLKTTSGETITLENVLQEIRLQTKLGKELEQNIMHLAVDLLARGKREIEND